MEARRAARDALSDAERQCLAARRAGRVQAIRGEPSEALSRCADLDDRVGAISASLRAREAEKIRRALARLDDWLLHGG